MSLPSDVAAEMQSLVTTLANSITDPSDAVRIFASLSVFPYDELPTTSTVGLYQQIVSNGVADLCRRSAVIALAQASSLYQPSSQNDAQTVQALVCGLLDDEILNAGDQGLDETFFSLTSLRNAVAQDLSTRGAALPPLQTFTTNVPMPALVLSYQYYGDISRTDQLTASANPIHPAMMPTSFTALSY